MTCPVPSKEGNTRSLTWPSRYRTDLENATSGWILSFCYLSKLIAIGKGYHRVQPCCLVMRSLLCGLLSVNGDIVACHHYGTSGGMKNQCFIHWALIGWHARTMAAYTVLLHCQVLALSYSLWRMADTEKNSSCYPTAALYVCQTLTLSLPRVINFKFPLQPCHYITQYEELGFSYCSLLRWKMIILPILIHLLYCISL